MTTRRNLISLLIITISLSGCGDTIVRQYLANANSHLKELKKTFGDDYLKSDLLSHFPEKVTDTTNFYMFSSPPACPPSFKCSAQFGEIYLITKKDSVTENWSIKNSLFNTKYNADSNIIINQTELRKDMFPIEKCNKSFDDKYPIPYFESYDFKLGEKTFKKEVEGEIYVDYIHTIPGDLNVFVLEAASGDFWKESCNENRPESLHEWKHGYSKGIAISEENDILIYWTMIW